MRHEWEKKISCALRCSECEKRLGPADPRVLSVYNHDAVCMECKKKEEKRPDYEEASRRMIGQCMADTELMYKDPGGYCYYHFYPFKCD
jgi:hypothetical protein